MKVLLSTYHNQFFEKRNYLSLLLLLLFSSSLIAQDAKFTASSSHTTVATGQQFKVEFSIHTNGSGFKSPDLSDFRILSGPNQSTSMSWVNGTKTSQMSYSYILMAIKEGQFTIGPASIQANGKTLSSNSIEIKVVQGASVPQQNNQGRSQQQNNISSQDAGKDVFLKAEVNKSSVYKGQPLIATYRLYTRVNIVDNDMEKMPSLNGFWSKDLIDLNGNVQWQTTVINGERYNVATLKKVLLFPIQTGKLTIDPWKMNMVIRKQVQGNSRSIFDQFFGRYEDQRVNIFSNPITIESLPLPEKGKPNDFYGMVGNFQLEINIDNNHVKANEAINLTVKVSGTGNLRMIDNPKLDLPDAFEVYDPDVNDKISVANENLTGSREFKYLIIPRVPGTYEIDPIHFSYFNPNDKTYHELKGDKIKLTIEKGEGGGDAQLYSGTEQKDIADLGNDIKYIKTSTHLTKTMKNNWNSKGFLFRLSLPFLLFLLAFGYKKKIEKDESNVGKMQNKRANKLVNKYLSKAKTAAKSADKNVFYQSILTAFDNYLSNKLSLDIVELSKESIREQLSKKGISEADITDLEKIKEECEIAQYAPMPSTNNDTILQQAADIIKKLEKGIKNA